MESCGGGSVTKICLGSTCRCEGCHERILAGRDFTINTPNTVWAKDFGFNDGDEQNTENNNRELVVLSDDDADDDGTGSRSDIFDINDDAPVDDGYCDDAFDDDDGAYSEFSPKPYTPDDQNDDLGLDELEPESDTEPAAAVEGVIGKERNDADSIEAYKKDREQLEKVVGDIETDDDMNKDREMGAYLLQEKCKAAKFWKEEIERFEIKMMQMDYKVSMLCGGLQVAKRVHDYEKEEIKCLQELVMEKTAESNQKDERIYNLTNTLCRVEHHYQMKDSKKEEKKKQTPNETIEERVSY